jgi:hypothetical protein
MKTGEELYGSEQLANPSFKLGGKPPKQAFDEQAARTWAVLLTGDSRLQESCAESAREQLTDWLSNSAEGTLVSISIFPEAFQTTRFWSEIKAVESPIRFLKPVLEGLRSGGCSFFTAMDQIGRHFGWNEERLLNWKQGLENLAGLHRWLPAFAHAYQYLMAAFPLGDEKLDRLRTVLIHSIEKPDCLLRLEARTEFDNNFLEFKKNYMDSYFLMHENALHVIGGMQKEARVDPIALRNLDLLSELQYTDKSYLNRVKLLAKWIQQNQCNLPLHQILESYPRCYCNFNPSSQQQPGSAVAQINDIIQEGLEYFRTILHRCDSWISLELDRQSIDPGIRQQIETVLGDGYRVPLKAEAIKVLDRIITKNSGVFLSEIRKNKKQISAE